MGEFNEVTTIENEVDEREEGSGGGFGLGMLIGSVATLAVFAGKKAWKKHRAKKKPEEIIDADFEEDEMDPEEFNEDVENE